MALSGLQRIFEWISGIPRDRPAAASGRAGREPRRRAEAGQSLASCSRPCGQRGRHQRGAASARTTTVKAKMSYHGHSPGSAWSWR